MANIETEKPSGLVVFAIPNFLNYVLARSFIIVALEMLSVAVGWQVYELTHRPFDLGLVGLAQFLPGILLFLVSGHAADLFDRRNVLAWCYLGFAICSALLLAIAWHGSPRGSRRSARWACWPAATA